MADAPQMSFGDPIATKQCLALKTSIADEKPVDQSRV